MGIGAHQRGWAKVARDPAIHVLDDPAGRAVRDDLTIPKQQDTVCVRQCKIDIVGHEVHGFEVRDREDLAHEASGRSVILARGRLVEHERRGLEGQGDRQGEALLLPEGQGQGRPLQDVLELVE